MMMSPVFVTGLLLSAGIGLSLGLIGGGGSILTVPILVYFFDVSPHDAVGMSLAVVGATSLIGSSLHYRSGNVDVYGGLLFGGAGTVGAFLGSPVTQLFSPTSLLLIFGIMMFVVAVLMLWKKQRHAEEAVHKPHQIQALLAGFGVGFLTGFLGVGGGFLIVPALVFTGGLTMKKAVGTSLFVIFLNCVAGLIGHASQNEFDLTMTAVVMALAVGGAIGGTVLSHRLDARHLQRGFGFLVLGVGVFLVAKNITIVF
jgi:uncharacterized membrane protein YfcA